MKWERKLITKVIVTATAGVVAAVMGCAVVVIAQGLPYDWSSQLAFSAPPSAAPAESNDLRYRILQNGIPEDWSHHHLVFSAPSTPQQRQLVEREPRYWMQQLRRQFQASSAASAAYRRRRRHRRRPPLKRDWSMTLGGAGSTVGAGMFPAKYSFSISATPSCSTDFVVYNTGMAGSPTQASILAYVAIYSGASPGCGTSRSQSITSSSGNTLNAAAGSFTSADVGAAVTSGTSIPSDTTIMSQTGSAATISKVPANAVSSVNIFQVPKVLWAYNTRGLVNGISVNGGTKTSPVLSLDGKQVAFIHAGVSGTTPASLVLLKWAASTSQSATLPGIPTGVIAANYRTCTAPCYTALAFSGGNTHIDSGSAPYYDYSTDVLYVGDDVGALHKFTNVFIGSPPAESGSPFSAVSSGNPLTGPVELSTGVVFVGVKGASGGLASVGTDGTATVDTNQIAAPGVTDAPLVDEGAGEVYAIVSSDGSQAAVLQYPTNFTSSTTPVDQAVGSLSSAVSTFAGTFDNTYFSSSSSSPTGSLYVCGNPGGAPTLYRLPITGNTLGSASSTLPLASGAATCSPISEVYNGSNDRAFLSTTANGLLTGCSGACVYTFDVTSGLGGTSGAGLGASGGTSGLVVDNISTQTGASQVYYSTLSTQACNNNSSSGGTGGCNVQASQAALQ